MKKDNQVKICPRCTDLVDCQPQAHSACGCTGIKLSAEVTSYISSNYNGCLCVPCLVQLKNRFYISASLSAA